MHFESYLSIEFFVYILRWIFSAFIMMIPLYLINKFKLTDNFKYKEYIDLILVQIIGAFIFWWIDQIIFKG
jgi:ABC-type glycerol-3-phosphate transport system permease component